MYLISLFILTYVTIITNGKKLKYYSNFNFKKLVFGPKDVVVDYLTLADDPIGNLPESYTTCSSVFVKFASTDIAVIHMMKQDDTPWYSLAVLIGSREYDEMSESLLLAYDDPTTEKFEVEFLTSSHIPIVPDSWYHICSGINTNTGMLRIAVNGLMLINEERDYFKSPIAWKPKSVEGSILVFKGFLSGFWYQHLSIFSNLNIFGTLMSVEDIVKRTAGGEACSSPADYLRSELSYPC